MITPLNRLSFPPETPDQALEFIHVADTAAQIILAGAATLEELAGDQTEAGVIACFAGLRAQERTHTEYQGARDLTPREAFEIAFIGSLGHE